MFQKKHANNVPTISCFANNLPTSLVGSAGATRDADAWRTYIATMILLLGAGGYIGSAFVRKFDSEEIDYRAVSRAEVDGTDRDALIALLRDTRPAFLINAAGFTGKPNVDACEDSKAECLLGNAVLPGIIRQACQACQIPWGHVSSGCIYSGTRPDGGGFKESDPPNFSFRAGRCSFYSGSKALGEECLQGADSVYVWRLRIPFNHLDSPRNYLSKILRYERLLNVTNSITQLDEFVSACLHCWNHRVPFGIYNVTNTGFVTTQQVAEKISDRLGRSKPSEFFRDESQFLQECARTPRSSCVLDNAKLLSTGAVMSDVQVAIDDALRRWVPQ